MKTAVYFVNNSRNALRSSCALLGAIRAVRAVPNVLLNACKGSKLLATLNFVKNPARLAQELSIRPYIASIKNLPSHYLLVCAQFALIFCDVVDSCRI
jgi:hypothetical protein